MKIAIFSDTFFPSVNGVANVIYNSAFSLLERGHKIQLYTCAKNPDDGLEKNFKGKINHIALPSLPFWGYNGEKVTLFSGKSLLSIKKFKPDIIHSHTPFSAGWEAILASKMNKIKLIGTHHTFFDDYLKYIKIDNAAMKKFSWQYTVFYYNHCNLVISPSKSLSNELIQNGLKSEIEVLSNPIDTNLFRPESIAKKEKLKNKFGIKGKSILYMGRLSYEKNIEQVINVFAQLIKINKLLILMIVGDGPDRKNLEDLSENIGVKNNVIFTGVLRGKKLIEAILANDIFITASKSENMPLAVLEAMSSGLPIIASADRGLKDIVENESNGYLVNFNDQKNVVEKIFLILKNQELSDKFSISSRNLSLKYSQEKITEKLENLYDKVLSK